MDKITITFEVNVPDLMQGFATAHQETGIELKDWFRNNIKDEAVRQLEQKLVGQLLDDDVVKVTNRWSNEFELAQTVKDKIGERIEELIDERLKSKMERIEWEVSSAVDEAIGNVIYPRVKKILENSFIYNQVEPVEEPEDEE
jgi:predicted transcriptional regulator